jgi:shikimate dehydrogenase
MQSISDISPSTRLCAIIGDPVGHSMSPAIHNAAFKYMGLDFVYLAFGVLPQNLAGAILAMRSMDNFTGLSVTIPHKIEVIQHLDRINDADRNTGSINTVIKRDGILSGLGSDGPGARKALTDKGIILKGNTVMLLGNGGAARAIAFDMAFNAPPGKLIIAGRNIDRVKVLTDDLSDKTDVNIEAVIFNSDDFKDAMLSCNVLINTTSVGMSPKSDVSPVDPELLHKNLCVMDIVYNPLETQLLKDAANKKLQTVSGLDMFVNQAAIQFESWTGTAAPVDIMRMVALQKLTI